MVAVGLFLLVVGLAAALWKSDRRGVVATPVTVTKTVKPGVVIGFFLFGLFVLLIAASGSDEKAGNAKTKSQTIERRVNDR